MERQYNAYCRQDFRGIGMIIKARDYMKKDGLLAIYNVFIYPYITYCNFICGATYESNLTRLVKLQNKIVRIIWHVKPRESCKPCYKSSGILPFKMINHYLIGCFVYRFCIGKVPFFIKTASYITMMQGPLIISMYLLWIWLGQNWHTVQRSHCIE